MSIEIEAKMQVSDIPALEAALQAAGAKRGPTLQELNTFFDSPTGALKTSDQGLRIRVEHEVDGAHRSVTLTHKGPRAHGKLKRRMETELQVSDARAAADLLNALGFVVVLSFEKRRRRWELDGCRVEIDTLPYLGNFVEIEGPDEKTIMEVREKLNLGVSPLIRPSYASMLATYLAEHHIQTNHVRLSDGE